MNRVIRSTEEYTTVMELLKENPAYTVAKMTGIPLGTVRNWKKGRSVSYQMKSGETSDWKKGTISQRIRDTTPDEFQIILDKTSSISEILQEYNLTYVKKHYADIVREKISSWSYDLQKHEANASKKVQHGEWSIEEMFTENSKICRSQIRRKVVRHKLIEYKCSGCSVVDEYNGKPLSLQLDHINGIRNDHRLINLRWLCPNCHSQQETSFGKNKKR